MTNKLRKEILATMELDEKFIKGKLQEAKDNLAAQITAGSMNAEDLASFNKYLDILNTITDSKVILTIR